MKVLAVGAGNMGGALLRRWVDMPDAAFAAVDPTAQPIDGVAWARGAEMLGAGEFDIVVLAVKPQLIDAVAPVYAARLASAGVVASIAAGVSIARLEALFGDVGVVRMMPNLPAQIGKGVSALCANGHASQEARAMVERLAEAAGEVVWMDDEDMIDRFTAIAGSGPGYVFEIARQFVAAASELGFPDEEARRIVLRTIEGAVALALDDGRPLAEMRAAVTSKNGTTEAGLAELMRDGRLAALMSKTVNAAYARARELADPD
ncbi:MAG: pyrroline-5-carboxylate reductase [Pseudomonadota bacterium]